jgi:hypothetical protein
MPLLLAFGTLLPHASAQARETVYLTAENGAYNVEANPVEPRYYLDFGGTDTYYLPAALAGPVTIVDRQPSSFMFSAGTRFDNARFAFDGIELVIGGQPLKILGYPAGSTFILDNNGRDFMELAELFGASVPDAGQRPVSGDADCTIRTGGRLDCSNAVNLNDTGIIACGDSASNNLDCPVSNYPRQDGDYGRDVTHPDPTDGHAGFSFTKLDATGEALPATATDWVCVHDNVSGLTWEVKTNDGGLRDRDWSYSWFNPDPNTNGSSEGYPDGGNCEIIDCDTWSYASEVNARLLCGFSDWRLPNQFELHSLLSLDRTDPAVDTDFFPNTSSVRYWSSSSYATTSAGPFNTARYVDFHFGFVNHADKSGGGSVRLVRSGN